MQSLLNDSRQCHRSTVRDLKVTALHLAHLDILIPKDPMKKFRMIAAVFLSTLLLTLSSAPAFAAPATVQEPPCYLVANGAGNIPGKNCQVRDLFRFVSLVTAPSGKVNTKQVRTAFEVVGTSSNVNDTKYVRSAVRNIINDTNAACSRQVLLQFMKDKKALEIRSGTVGTIWKYAGTAIAGYSMGPTSVTGAAADKIANALGSNFVERQVIKKIVTSKDPDLTYAQAVGSTITLATANAQSALMKDLPIKLMLCR